MCTTLQYFPKGNQGRNPEAGTETEDRHRLAFQAHIQLPVLYLWGPPARGGTTHGAGTYLTDHRSRICLVCLPIGQVMEAFYQVRAPLST